MATLSTMFDLSLIPGAIISRLTYRRNSTTEMSGTDVTFMVVTSYAIYYHVAQYLLTHL